MRLRLTLLGAAPPATAQTSGGIETVVVTAQKRSENIQNVPIAISAFTQKELKSEQVAGGPDLIKEIPNVTFSKTNFTGYNIQIRGIGTQAISVTTDPAVAIAFNNIPFIRNHFFEQEFFDVEDVEVLRGPQGTLYGRNAPAGVVNIVSAKPTGEYEASASVDVGNYDERRLEAMVNLPIDGDRLALRLAGEWTTRDGYAFNEQTKEAIDGRNLWSGPRDAAFRALRGAQSQSRLGAFLGKRRSRPLHQAAMRKGSRSFGSRRPPPGGSFPMPPISALPG